MVFIAFGAALRVAFFMALIAAFGDAFIASIGWQWLICLRLSQVPLEIQQLNLRNTTPRAHEGLAP